jgi:hypothetical protein
MTVDSSSQSMARVRWSARAPRLALLAVCAVLTAVGLRTVLATPAPAARTEPARTSPAHLEAQAVAEEFARAYLSSDRGTDAQRRATLGRLAPAVAQAERDDPLPAAAGSHVLWSAVLGDQPTPGGDRVTVLVETDRGATALVVDTQTTAQGVTVTGFPAVVGPPRGSTVQPPDGEAVDDGRLSSTIGRALGNYLAGRSGDLVADLLPGAVVSVPAQPLRLIAIDDLVWAGPGRSVRAEVRAQLSGAGELRLAYEIGVARRAGRWFVSWIGSSQTTSGRQ